MSYFSTLISVSQLVDHMDQPNWVILDCQHDLADKIAGKKAFLSGHIPRAQFVDVNQDLSDLTVNNEGAFFGRHPLPKPEAWLEKLRAWGISADTQVVVYDAQGGMFAARCWWMLRWIGHAAVAVLDGGLKAWSDSYPLSLEETKCLRGTIELTPSLVSSVGVADVLANLASHVYWVVDARSPERFRGENETLDQVGGHIPGAKNRFFKDNLLPNGYFKSPKQLRKEWQALVGGARGCIMQCGSGITACHNLLAYEIAGLGMHQAVLYPGSWSEWCADPLRPIALGDE